LGNIKISVCHTVKLSYEKEKYKRVSQNCSVTCCVMHIYMYIYICIYTHTYTCVLYVYIYTHIHRVIQSLHTIGKWSLYLQNVLCTGTITLLSHADVSPLSRRTQFNISGVMCARASLMRSFRWSIFCSFTWYTTAFRHPPPPVTIK
jgi:hypothetical protein